MCKHLYPCLLLAALNLIACKSRIFSDNEDYKNTIITPAMHLEALYSYPIYGTGTIQILDSGFYYKYRSHYILDDIFVNTRIQGGELVPVDTATTDIVYIVGKCRSGLSRARRRIGAVEKSPSSWDDKLFFKLDLTVQKKDGTDTLVQLYYRWNHPDLKY